MIVEELLYALLLAFVFSVLGFIFVAVCSPTFWQGLRNSKFLDKLKKERLKEEQMQDLIDPDK